MLHSAELACLPAIWIHNDKRTNRLQADKFARVDVPGRRSEAPGFEKVEYPQDNKEEDLCYAY